MSIPKNLDALVGNWNGNNRLHLSWLPEPIHDSPGTAAVTRRVGDQFLEIAYTWLYEGQPREGVLLLAGDNKSDVVNAFWTDSWHMAHQILTSEGNERPDGSVSVKGNYKVEGHPDWGWRTEIIPGNSLKYKMYNVSPEGVEEIAVEMELERA